MKHAMIVLATLTMISAGCAKQGQHIETTGAVDNDDTGKDDEQPADDSNGDTDATPIDTEDMTACDTADDCVTVACACKCSGCGGFYFEDVVNKAFEEWWYEEKGCKKANVCPEVCCPGKMTLACAEGRCVVEWEGVTAEEAIEWSLGE